MTTSITQPQTHEQIRAYLQQPELITLCSFCSKTKLPDNSWESIDHSNSCIETSSISHGFCPGCTREHYPTFSWD